MSFDVEEFFFVVDSFFLQYTGLLMIEIVSYMAYLQCG